MINLINCVSFFENFARDFNLNFIEKSRYMLLLNGLGVTIMLSIGAACIGIIIGMVITFFKLSKHKPLNIFANIYIDIIRGTPSVTQLVVFYFILFASVNINKILIGAIAFGINSGAYVAEIIRAGILSIDKGQLEAGRSLGLTNAQTMRLIILPQAIKNILPALANEFIVLIKETAIAGYIAVTDLTKASTDITSVTYQTMPIMASAVIYYILIKILTIMLNKLEKRLRKSDIR